MENEAMKVLRVVALEQEGWSIPDDVTIKDVVTYVEEPDACRVYELSDGTIIDSNRGGYFFYESRSDFDDELGQLTMLCD